MDEAPKKPSMPGMRASASTTLSGSSKGPPWQMTRMSLRTLRPASAIVITLSIASSSVKATAAPMLPAVVNPTCATSWSAPAWAMALASSASKT